MSIRDGVCHFIYKKRELVDYDDSERIIRKRLEWADGETYPYLFDIRGVGRMTKGARDNFANAGNDLVSASALLIGSVLIRVTANFFINVSKPKNPTRMFTDQEKALEWLEAFKD